VRPRAILQGVLFGLGRKLPPGAVRAINLARGIDAPRLVELPPGKRPVVVAPHPDDELIGCGGTIVKHSAAGHPIHVVMATSGERSASFVGSDSGSARAQREGEALAGLSEVGVEADRVTFLRLREGELEGADMGPMARVLGALSPDLLYVPSPGDGHADHAATSRLVAACLTRLPTVRHVALYEVMTPVYPTVVVDISEQVGPKLAGLQRYESALASVDFVHTSRGLAAYRSVHCMHGRGHAEAFTLLRPGDFALLARQEPAPRP